MKALLTIVAAVLFAGTVLQAQTVQESKARYTVMMETRMAGGLTGGPWRRDVRFLTGCR